MSRFKIGQRVVAIVNHSEGDFKIGGEFIVDGFNCCKKCGEPSIYVVGINATDNMNCECGYLEYNTRIDYAEECFAPLTSLSDAIEYRLKVSEPELEALRVKEVSLQ